MKGPVRTVSSEFLRGGSEALLERGILTHGEKPLASILLSAILRVELDMARHQAESPKKTSRPEGLSVRFSRTLRMSYFRVRGWVLFRDRLASSLGIDVPMVERYLRENEEIKRKAETDPDATDESARATIPPRASRSDSSGADPAVAITSARAGRPGNHGTRAR